MRNIRFSIEMLSPTYGDCATTSVGISVEDGTELKITGITVYEGEKGNEIYKKEIKVDNEVV